MFDSTNLHEWSLDRHLAAFQCVTPKTSASTTQRVFIPALMPKGSLPQGAPKSIDVSLRQVTLANDSPCMPAYSNTIRVQNYVTVSLPGNQNFKASLIDGGAKLMVETINENPDTLQLTTNLDPSYNPPPI